MDQRADRMKTLIVNTFFVLLKEEDFSQVTVGKLSEAAQITEMMKQHMMAGTIPTLKGV